MNWSMSAEGTSEIEELKQEHRQAKMHKAVAAFRSDAKKQGAMSAKFTKKSLYQKWWVDFYTKRAVKHRTDAKKINEKVAVIVQKNKDLRTKIKDLEGKKKESVKDKVKSNETKIAKLREKARNKEARAAKHNERAAGHKIKSKQFEKDAKETEMEHDEFMSQADLLEKVTD